MRSSTALFRGAAAAAALAALSCAAPSRLQRQLHDPSRALAVPEGTKFLKAHLRDGRLAVFSAWTVDEPGGLVAGTGMLYGPRRDPAIETSLSVSVAEVALFETNVAQPSGAVAALTVVGALSAGATAFCLTNTKACFGSCPTFYVPDGTGAPLEAEGFSSSVAPSLEASDLDALPTAHVDDGRLRFEMRNEALETHVVRHVHVLAAPRPAGGRVYASVDGRFWAGSTPRPPSRCRAAEGDCTALVAEADGRERSSTTDGVDLARRETIDLTFDADPGAAGLVLKSRQTLLSTFLFYQTLAYMGRDATAWLARLESGDARVRRAAGALDELLGGIEVLVADEGGRFRVVGDVRETGPLARDVKVVPLPRRARPGPLHVRLRLTRGHWRLDQVGLTTLAGPVEAARLRPTSVRHRRTGASWDESRGQLVTLPGDAWTFEFAVPGGAPQELFLESRGYYLEWMRDEWLKEEDPVRLARLLRHPRRALRELAPAFKDLEPKMEQVFWSSRHAVE